MGSEQTYLHESEVLYDEIFPELYQFGGKLVFYLLMYLRQRIKLETNFEFCAEEKNWGKTNCSVGLSAEFGRRNGRKLLPEKFFRPPDNPPNLPSVQNNRFPCCFENLLHSGILHFFPFPDNPLNSGSIYGTLYYLPHLLTFPRKSKNHTIHRRLLSN